MESQQQKHHHHHQYQQVKNMPTSTHSRVYQQAPHLPPTSSTAVQCAPTLVGDKVVLGPKQHHIDVVLNGQNNGKMPAWRQLSDVDIASVITYTRNSWGDKAGEGVVQPPEVKAERK